MSTIPTINRPDGMPQDCEEARQWCRSRLLEAVEHTYLRHDHGRALELVQEAEHGLRVLMLEQRADVDGTMREP